MIVKECYFIWIFLIKCNVVEVEEHAIACYLDGFHLEITNVIDLHSQ